MLSIGKFSIFKTFLIIAITTKYSITTDCTSSFIADTSLYCSISSAGGTPINSAELFCASDFETLDYLKIAPTTFCDEVIYGDTEDDEPYTIADCYELIDQDSQNDLIYFNFNGSGVCSMTKGEFCYRNLAERQKFGSKYTLIVGHVSTGTEQECCSVECQNKYPFFDGACDNKENEYSTNSSLCDAYCANRSLKFAAACSVYGDVDCSNYPGCDTECKIPTEGEAVCGDDGNLYDSSANYCQALDAGDVTGFSTCEGGCQVSDCSITSCLLYLEKINYKTATICGDSGTFYENHKDYCAARVSNVEKYFLLCEGEACTAANDCCLKHCKLSYDESTEFCASDFTAYDNRDDYCNDNCDGTPVELNSDCGANCSADECCEVECLSESYFDTCVENTNTLYTQSSYCYDSCFNTIEITVTCTDEGNITNCTQSDCDYIYCLYENDSTFTTNSFICGETNGPITLLTEYCSKRYLTSEESGILLCNGVTCTSQTDCEIAKCEYDNSDSFVNQCAVHNSTNEFYDSLTTFCEDDVNDGVTNVKCDGAECTRAECCIKNCPLEGDVAYCDSEFNLRTDFDDCVGDCNNDTGFVNSCLGGCTQSDCDKLKCLDNFSNPVESLCLYNSDNSFNSVQTVSYYCSNLYTDDTIDYYQCGTTECIASTNNSTCDFDKCMREKTNFRPTCNTDYDVLNSLHDYCAEINLNDGGISMCGALGSEYECNLRDCCNLQCESENHLDSCSVDYYWIYTAEEFCAYRCDGYVIGREDIVVDTCEDSDGADVDCTNCLLFKCRDQNSTFENPICHQYGSSYEYFATLDDYCNDKIGKEFKNFDINDSLTCDGTCTDDKCCLEDCKERNSDYSDKCDTDSYSVLDLTDYCTRTCNGDDINYESCSGDCVQNDCDVLECIATASPRNSSICLNSPVDSTYFFDNVSNFCNAVVPEITSSFALNGSDLACGDNGCDDEDDCCYYRCLTETYINTCNSSTYEVVDHETFCAYRCSSTNSLRTDLSVDLCPYDSSGTACTDCEIFKCMDDINDYSNTSICLSNGSSVEYYSTHYDYCVDKLGDGVVYTFDNDVNCEGNCSSEIECCYYNCMNDSSFEPGCNSSYDFIDQDTYCSAACNDSSINLSYCSLGTCSDYNCAYEECRNSAKPTYSSICTEFGVDGDYYFESFHDYCIAKVDANETDYSNLNEVFCNTDGRCTSNSNCMKYVCLLWSYTAVCDKSDYSVVSKDAYCSYLYDESNTEDISYYVEGCSNEFGQFNCSEDDCRIKECINSLNDDYGSSTMCSINGDFYDSIEDFCNAVDGYTSDVLLCDDEPCGNVNDCCTEYCNSYVSFDSVCIDGTYDYITDKAEFCDLYCPTGSVDEYTDASGNSVSSEECNTQKCILEGGNDLPVCNGDTYELITSVELCSIAASSGINIETCDELDGCTQDDCDKLRCLDELKALYGPSTSVCNDSGDYVSFDDYCTAKHIDKEDVDLLLCNGSNCGSATSCLKAHCLSITNDYVTVCTAATFDLLETEDDYCDEYANNDKVVVTALCNGYNCSANECCELKCNSEISYDKCSESPLSSVITVADYCSNYCIDSNYASTTQNCEGDCSSDDCVYFDCINEVSTIFEDNSVCAKDSILYVNFTAFCLAHASNYSEYLYLCSGYEICADGNECCQQTCNSNNNDVNFVERCNNEYTYFPTNNLYCEHLCSTGSSYSGDLLCEDDTRFCTHNECCMQKCMDEVYEGYCNDSFDFLTQEEFCTLNCPLEEYVPVTCEGGCTEVTCALKKCRNNLINYPYSSVCLQSGTDGYTFYSSVYDYCDAVKDPETASYSISDDTGCGDSFDQSCSDSTDCCKYDCLSEQPYTVCNANTYVTISASDYCDDQCGLQTLTVDKCYNDDGDQVSCSDCNYFQCIDDMDGYSFKVCIDDEGYILYDNVDSFCLAESLNDQEDYYDLKIDCNDDEGVIECANDTSCCEAVCKSNNNATFKNLCDTSSYLLVDLNTYCSNDCSSGVFAYDNCGSSDCSQTDCNKKNCMTNYSDENSICLIDPIYDNYYFDDPDAFCTAASTGCDIDDPESNCEAEYDITDAEKVLCNGTDPCATKIDCCVERCLTNTYFDSCNSSSFDLIYHTEYCDYRCSSGNVASDTYTDMDIVNCYDEFDSLVACTQQDCDIKKCKSNLSADYASTNVCASDVYYYETKDTYCEDYLGDESLIIECDGGPCATDEACCNAQCNSVTDQVNSVCSVAELLWRSTVSDFCTEYCADNAQVFIIYTNDQDVNASEEECNIQYCIENDNTLKDVCSTSDWTVVTTDEQCAYTNTAVTTDDIATEDCDEANCTLDDCNYKKCISVNGGSAATDFCVVNGSYYSTVQALCSAVAPGYDYTLFDTCNTLDCTTSDLCCIQNCLDDNEDTFTTVCSSTYVLYENVIDYCTDYCTVEDFSLLRCPTEICDETECRIEICKNDSYTDVCDPTYIIMTQDEYCEDKYNNDRADDYYHTCSGSCTQDICTKDKCLETIVQTYSTTDSICANDEVFYANKDAFCDEYVENEDLLDFLCGAGNLCDDADTCCNESCVSNNESSYTARCNSDYSWLDTVESYCAVKCDGSYEVYNCGKAVGTCTEYECCYDGCMASEYVDKCGSDYVLLDQSDYCELECTTKDYVSCTGSCTQNSCNVLKCKNDNKDFTGPVCFVDSPLDGYFYVNKNVYCDAAGIDSDISTDAYTIDSANIHDCGSDCIEGECYVVRCSPGKNDVCDGTTYEIITVADYCSREYQDDLPSHIDYCGPVASRENCTTCEYFKCMDQFDGYEYTKVCSNEEGTSFFSNTVSDFCDAKKVENLVDYKANLVQCYNSSGSAVECSDEDQCTIQVCINEESAGYYDLCSDTFAVFNIRDHCTKKLDYNYDATGCDGNPEYSNNDGDIDCFYSCGNTSCVVNDCEYFDCMTNITTSLSDAGICFNSKPNNTYFYLDYDSFCTDAAANDFSSYLATGNESILCGNGTTACTSANDCCIARCLLETPKSDYCDATTYELKDFTDYCSDRCLLSGDDNDTYTLPSIKECRDSNDDLVDCETFDCNVFKCIDDFDQLGYDYSTVCLDTDETYTLEFFFGSVKGYCENLITSDASAEVDALPNTLTCSSSSCSDYIGCCEANCNASSLETFCDEDYALTTEAEYCEYICATIEDGYVQTMTKKTCTGACTTCKYIKCKEDIQDGNPDYVDNTPICSLNEFNGIYYFNNLDGYCATAASETDESTAIGIDYNEGFSQILCVDGNGAEEPCNTLIDCCNAVCNNEVFYNKCDTDFNVFSDETSFCQNKCDETPLTLTDCYELDGETLKNCTAHDCCEQKYERVYTTRCGTDGVLYDNVSDFCDAVGLDSSLNEHQCEGSSCSEEQCYIDFCLGVLDAEGANGSICDVDNIYYADGTSFCEARFANKSLNYIDNECVPSCTQADCCSLITTEEDAVIVFSESSRIHTVANKQIADCNDLPLIYECTADSQDECSDEFDNICKTFCELTNSDGSYVNQPDPTKNYCASLSGYYSSLEHCMLFECSSSNWYDTYVANPGCENSNCSSSECSIQQCIEVCEPGEDVCGMDGNVYDSACVASCYDVTVNYLCLTTIGGDLSCSDQCEYDKCVTDTGAQNLQKTCADTTIYDNQCYAKIANATFKFVCPVDECTSAVRLNRCKFDCDNEEVWVSDI